MNLSTDRALKALEFIISIFWFKESSCPNILIIVYLYRFSLHHDLPSDVASALLTNLDILLYCLPKEKLMLQLDWHRPINKITPISKPTWSHCLWISKRSWKTLLPTRTANPSELPYFERYSKAPLSAARTNLSNDLTWSAKCYILVTESE